MNQPASMFLPVFILLLVTLTVGCIILVLSGLILPKVKPNNPNAIKLSAFECGAPPMQTGARHRYSVKFYLTAMLFILFDVEAAFLLPWARSLDLGVAWNCKAGPVALRVGLEAFNSTNAQAGVAVNNRLDGSNPAPKFTNYQQPRVLQLGFRAAF